VGGGVEEINKKKFF
jgi:uridine phosphorylase